MVLVGVFLEMDAEVGGTASERDIDRPVNFPDNAGPIANGPLAVISASCRGIPRPLPLPLPSSVLRDDGADSCRKLPNQSIDPISWGTNGFCFPEDKSGILPNYEAKEHTPSFF